jgi:ADP-dependent phosphofructokinase/glucokinase
VSDGNVIPIEKRVKTRRMFDIELICHGLLMKKNGEIKKNQDNNKIKLILDFTGNFVSKATIGDEMTIKNNRLPANAKSPWLIGKIKETMFVMLNPLFTAIEKIIVTAIVPM